VAAANGAEPGGGGGKDAAGAVGGGCAAGPAAPAVTPADGGRTGAAGPAGLAAAPGPASSPALSRTRLRNSVLSSPGARSGTSLTDRSPASRPSSSASLLPSITRPASALER